MKKTDKVVVYLNKIFHFVNAFCCTWGMVVIFIIVPITGLLKWPTIALLIQVVFLLGGFILLGIFSILEQYRQIPHQVCYDARVISVMRV